MSKVVKNKLQLAEERIFSCENEFSAVAPKDFDCTQFMSTLFSEVKKTPKLMFCKNLIEAAKAIAKFNLILGSDIGQCYLIPYGETAKLIIGYKGYVTKLDEQGYTVESETVTHEELAKGCFQEVRGSNPQIIHNPIRTSMRTRENIALVYCIITGEKIKRPRITVLCKEEVEEKAGNGKRLGNVWTANVRATDYGEMCKKTALRDCVKRVSLGVVNKMSSYEGEQEKTIVKDVTPKNIATLDDFKDLEKAREEKEKKDLDNQEEIVLNTDGRKEVANEQ